MQWALSTWFLWPEGSLKSRAAGQSVTDPRLADEVLRVRGIALDFLAELCNQHPEMLRLFDRVRAPNRLQDGAMRQDTVDVAREERQQLELLRSQTDVVIAADDATAVEVDDEVCHFDPFKFRGLGLPQATEGDSNSREQFFGAERLRHVVVGAEIECRHFVRLAAAG